MKPHPVTISGACLVISLLASRPAAASDCKFYPEELTQPVGHGRAIDTASLQKHQNGITYVTGGVAEEKPALERIAGRYNLKLQMKTPCGRLSAGALRIEDGTGKVLVDAPDAGPLFLATVPAGNYKVHVTPASGQPLAQTISVASSGQTQVVLTIPGSPGD